MTAICFEPQDCNRAGYAQFQQDQDQHQWHKTLGDVMPRIKSSRNVERKKKGQQETKL